MATRTRRRLGVPPLTALIGPAFVAAIAYVDPGNIVANMQAANRDGYLLLWAVVAASAVAVFVQLRAATLGAASGRSLAELCAARLPAGARVAMWLQCEVMAAATDVAEFIGAAVGLRLLFGLPLLAAGVLTTVVSFALLHLQARAASRFEVAVAALLAVIACCFVYETFRAGPSAGRAVAGLSPSLAGPGAVLLATSIVGATVMPHAIYLHSHLAARQAGGLDREGRSGLLVRTRRDVGAALSIAGVVNVAMLLVAAGLFGPGRFSGALTLVSAHAAIGRRLGGAAALVFSVGLLASGLSSSSVGTLAGQTLMASFTRRRLPVSVRRAVTVAPAMALLAVRADLDQALLVSQAVLSFGIPFALVPLTLFSADRDLMGRRTPPAVLAAGVVITGGLVALNAVLLVQLL